MVGGAAEAWGAGDFLAAEVFGVAFALSAKEVDEGEKFHGFFRRLEARG